MGWQPFVPLGDRRAAVPEALAGCWPARTLRGARSLPLAAAGRPPPGGGHRASEKLSNGRRPWQWTVGRGQGGGPGQGRAAEEERGASARPHVPAASSRGPFSPFPRARRASASHISPCTARRAEWPSCTCTGQPRHGTGGPSQGPGAGACHAPPAAAGPEMGHDCVPLTEGPAEQDTCQEAWCWRSSSWTQGSGRARATPQGCSPGPEAPAAGVVGPAVHALLDVGLSGPGLGRELLLLPGKLGGVEAGVAGGHARCHGVAAWIHGVVGIGHRVPEDLWAQSNCHPSGAPGCGKGRGDMGVGGWYAEMVP